MKFAWRTARDELFTVYIYLNIAQSYTRDFNVKYERSQQYKRLKNRKLCRWNRHSVENVNNDRG